MSQRAICEIPIASLRVRLNLTRGEVAGVLSQVESPGARRRKLKDRADRLLKGYEAGRLDQDGQTELLRLVTIAAIFAADVIVGLREQRKAYVLEGEC